MRRWDHTRVLLDSCIGVCACTRVYVMLHASITYHCSFGDETFLTPEFETDALSPCSRLRNGSVQALGLPRAPHDICDAQPDNARQERRRRCFEKAPDTGESSPVRGECLGGCLVRPCVVSAWVGVWFARAW